MRVRIFMRRLVLVPDRGVCPVGVLRPGVEAGQIALEQNGGGHTIHRALPLFPAHVGGDQEIFRRFRRHPLIPQHQRDGQFLLQPGRELPHGLDRGTFPSVQLERESQDHPADFVRRNQLGDMGEVLTERPPLECFQRLSCPPQLVAQGHADPLGAVVQCQYA